MMAKGFFIKESCFEKITSVKSNSCTGHFGSVILFKIITSASLTSYSNSHFIMRHRPVKFRENLNQNKV